MHISNNLSVSGDCACDKRNATTIVFRGRWVDPNSIFCRDHERHGVEQTCQTLIQQMDVWSHMID